MAESSYIRASGQWLKEFYPDRYDARIFPSTSSIMGKYDAICEKYDYPCHTGLDRKLFAKCVENTIRPKRPWNLVK